MFSFQTEPGKLLSDELGKASEARPFARKKQGWSGGAARRPGKTNAEIMKNYS